MLCREMEGYTQFQGRLSQSAQTIADCAIDLEVDRLGERLGTYGAQDCTERSIPAACTGMKAKFRNLAVKAGNSELPFALSCWRFRRRCKR
ncbi:MAG: hypothetical protein U0905_11575 [Pirellulales bacterium]